ncbi:MAG: glycosyltransferase family 39 protein [Bacilli bacterium]|nr:glycosyltransferase family 39 protein [Bacilli bacterium]
MKKNQSKNKNGLEIVAIIGMTLLLEYAINFLETPIKDLILWSIIFISIGVFLLNFDKKNMNKNIVYLIYFAGLMIRTVYILKTDITIRQHDVGSIDEEGHLAYIYILYSTFKLPTTNIWQFYHPPLWHFIASLWMRLHTILNQDKIALEGIQALTVCLSSLTILITNKICEKLKMKDIHRCLTILLIAFHPTMIILSGSINNDILMIMLEYLIILLLINWYKEANYKNTILLAIVTGLCVMTKMNGAVMAVPILYVFFAKAWDLFVKNKKMKKAYIQDFLLKMFIFGMISLPIGLWFQVRNIVLFDTNNVPNPGKGLYVGKHSFISRFLTIDFPSLFRYAFTKPEYNLPSYLIKTSVFGEYSYGKMGLVEIVLVVLSVIILLISTILMIKYLIKDRKNVTINMLIVTLVTNLISMIVFNMKYPYICYMDFRYVAIVILPIIVMITYSLNTIKNKFLRIPIEIVICFFILFSIIFELKI